MNLFEDCVCEYYNSSSFCCERTIDTIQICVHGLFFTVFLVFLLALNWMAKKASVKPRARNFVHLPLHKTRWMLLLQLVPCQLALVVEGILIGAMYHVEFLHLCVPYIIGALCTSMSLAFYDRLEKTRTSKPLAVLLLYWNISLGSSCVKNVALYCSDDKWSARLVFSLWVTVTYLILVTVEVIVLHKMKYMCKSKVTIQAPEEAHSLTYVHSQSCFLSQITWHWLTHILIQGYRKPLHLDDLGQLPKSEQTEKIYETFRNVYEEEKMKAAAKGKQLSLWKCYWRHSGKIIIMTGILKLLSDNMLYIGPVLLGFLVDIIQDERDFFISNHTEEVNSSSIPPMSLESYFTNSYIICLLMTVISVIQVTMTQNMSYFCSREGIRIKAAVQSLVYSKSLQLPESTLSDGQMSVGRVINHLSTDAVNILMLFYLGHFVWAMPIQILVGLLLLYYELGVSALLSGLLIVLMVPIQYLIGRQISSLQSKVMVHSDKRLKQSGELLHNIRLVKLYVWESLFTETVLKTRNQELKCLLLVAFLRVLSLCVCDSSPVIACLLTFTLHSYWSNEPLRASRVFASLAIFGFLSNSLFIITLVINVFCFGAVSTRRLEKFMMSTEVEEIHDKDVDDQLPLVQYKMSSVGSVHLVGCEQSDGLTEEVEPMIADSEISLPVDQGVEMTKADIIIKTKHAYVTWQKDEEVFNSQSFTLKDVTVTVKKGELFMIVGPVGCGKSSLLSAFLGEMFVVKGQVEISRSEDIAYVPQKAWLMNATVRDNILFDKQFDADRYQSVLEMCALLPDLETLVAGDETEVGEKGVNLSGGQRQRINIARAIYSQPSLILMDDPLSALDASVAEHVFMNAIKDHLLKSGVTVVLVTHQMKYVTHAGTVCYLDGGRVLFQGKPCHLLGSGIDFLQAHVNSMTGKECVSPDISVTNDDTHIFASNLNNSQRDNQPLIGEPNLELDNGKQDRDHKVPLNSRLTPPDVNTMEIHPVGRLSCAISAQSMSSLILQDQEPCQTRRPAVTEDSQEDLEVGRLVTEEAQTTGVVQLSVYLAYARAATWPLLIISLLGYSSRQALKMLLDYWLTLWISASRSQTENKLCYSLVYGQQRLCENNITKMEDNQLSSIDYYYMTRYLVITLVAVLLAFLTYLITEIMSLIAARALFKRLLMNIVRAPLRFFDITPVGRILNRMSGDVQIIDQKMVTSLDQVLYCTLFVLGVIIINTLTTPYFVLLAIPMLIAFFLVQRFYIASSRELQRLDCITKSPVLTHFSETLHGLSSIRAYKAKERMMKKLWKVVDDNNLALLFFHTTNAWMAIRLEYLSAGIIFAASICSVTVCLLGYISPEMVGLAVSYAIMVASFVSWSVRGMSEFEMWFNSVQRVLDYMDIESEKRPGHQDLENLPEDWPTCGSVIFDDVSISYDESLPPVIHHLSVEIKHGQKIGICGRTGSGKSTITLSMFSVLHICEGQIRIDGQDITRVPLDRLRVSIAIIPQDPVLFSGTIRYNLDPTHSLTDDEIWQALEVAQLKDVLSESPLLLESQVSEGGQNFSTGQRQLFCLARAILRHSQILIMDEATASVDFVTDRIIQDVIRTAFANKTVLTIAHRVSTIMACDMILVIEDGHLVECDTPPNLLATESRFATMLTNHQL